MLLEATTIQTIIREITADLETPVSLYLKLRGDGASFLLESVEGGERIARYSFIGVQPRAEYILRDGQVEIKDDRMTRAPFNYERRPDLLPAGGDEPLSSSTPRRMRRASRVGWWAISGMKRSVSLSQLLKSQHDSRAKHP